MGTKSERKRQGRWNGKGFYSTLPLRESGNLRQQIAGRGKTSQGLSRIFGQRTRGGHLPLPEKPPAPRRIFRPSLKGRVESAGAPRRLWPRYYISKGYAFTAIFIGP